MTTYTWPGWCVNEFQMRVKPNVRVFSGPYTPSIQTLDFLGERWWMTFNTVPGVNQIDGGNREAFFDRLRGPVNRVRIWNLRRPVPLGTFRAGAIASVVNGALQPVTVVNAALQPVTVIYGTAVTATAASKGASTVTISHIAGRTLEAGDMLGLGGQLVRVMARSVANGAGQMTVEFFPRLRNAFAANTEVQWDKPTAEFILQADGVPVVHRPGVYDGSTVDLIEAI